MDIQFVVFYVNFVSFFLHKNYFVLYLASAVNDENDFIYRIETDDQPKNLIGVIDFCAELGGYPIYAYNAYEWQLVQGILFINIEQFI